MGFFNKIKDILFEEVDEEENKVAVGNREIKVEPPIAEKIEPQKTREPEVVTTPNYNYQPREVKEPVREYNTELNTVKTESSFSFPDFDEEEFLTTMSRTQAPKSSTNVIEYEKKKKIEKKYDYNRYERIEKTEVVEKKRFKPSPIISPVYGILNEDYRIEDIKDKTEENAQNNLDFNSVRKKAFENVSTVEKQEQPTETYYEETVTVKLKENEEKREQQVKTIDELLEDTADLEISVDEEPVINEYNNIEEELEEVKEEPTTSESDQVEDDTLESDLFDLIDSMYDSREDGEY